MLCSVFNRWHTGCDMGKCMRYFTCLKTNHVHLKWKMQACVIILFVPHNVQCAWCLSSWSSRPVCKSASCFWQKNGTSRRWEIFSLLYACCQSHSAYCILCNNLYMQSTLITHVVLCGILMQGAVFVRECSQSFNKQPQRPKGNM